MKIKLKDIRIDGNTQFRDRTNEAVVKEYQEAMMEGKAFPPLKTVFDGATHWLFDGFHRAHAIRNLGLEEIEVDYIQGSQEDAQILAMGANSEHGLQRTNADKRKVVEAAIIHPRLQGKSNREIADICKVSHSFVAAIRDPEVKERQRENVKKHYENKEEPAQDTGVELHDMNMEIAQDNERLERQVAELEIKLATESLMESAEAKEQITKSLETKDEEIARLKNTITALERTLEAKDSSMNAMMIENNELKKQIKSMQKSREQDSF
jgi:chromosome segregation ATPase